MRMSEAMEEHFGTLLNGGIEVVAERAWAVNSILQRCVHLMGRKEVSQNLKVAYCDFQVLECQRKSWPRPHTSEQNKKVRLVAQNLRAAILMEK